MALYSDRRDKGGSFDVKQEPVAPGYWELTVLNVHMTGKALFFKSISERYYAGKALLCFFR